MTLSTETRNRYERLRSIIQSLHRVIIGFSGGVDSTFLSYVAHDVLGDDALAVTAVSPTLPAGEKADAERMAQVIGIRHLFVQSTEFSDDSFVQNPPDRCYICKKIRFTALVEMANEKGYTWVIDGGNVDDLGDYRPGMKALAELSDHVKSPMIEAGLTKADIRTLSKHFGLQTWNKQSAACLASRIPYGMTLTAERLTQIDKAEQVIAPFITGSLRVRYHGDLARIEVADDEIPVILAHRKDITSALRRLGFTYVTVDLGGYEMGSLNEVLEKGEDVHESHTKSKG